jgi:methionyl-tRNA synthetase
MSTSVYLTTPLYYVNAEPHLGHTYTTVLVDTVARYNRSIGRDVFFLTGTDEHGDKIAQAAAERGYEPRDYADRVSTLFRSTWDECGITYDHFIRTTDQHHVAFVKDILAHVHDKGDIYFGEYGGNYCTGCERFYTDKELVDGNCPDHQRPPVWIAEENYFFRMSRYQDRLIDHVRRNEDFIRPAGYRNEVLGLLREPLEDLCISRPKSRLTWGIELPFDSNYVTYVWFDALINYLSGLYRCRPDDASAVWPMAQHFIAKDILKPHAVFWPTMLMAADRPLYAHLNVHGYWNMGESKMSKSLGNVIRPLEMKERFGLDSFRYFLLREMVFGMDSAFTEDAFVARFNADLSNGLGNLVSRVLSMQHKYFGGVVQSHTALEEIWKAFAVCDKYIVDEAPFKKWKQDGMQRRVGAILHVLCDALVHGARLIAPFMPETAARMTALLNVSTSRLADPTPLWFDSFAAEHRVAKPEPLFPRIEVEGRA